MRAGWNGDMDRFAVPPAIRLISCRDLNVSLLSFSFCSIYAQAPIALFDHRRVRLPVCGKADHQLRHN